MEHFNSKIPLTMTAVIVSIGLGLTQPNFVDGTRKHRELIAPPTSLQYFTFGFKEPIADILWIRSLQDFDYCENLIATNVCQGNGWLTKTLDLITDLSPYFRMAYSAGGMALTIIVSDYPGASKIFDKAVTRFPTDWIIIYKAAYHALFEEKDKVKAAMLMERAAAHGAPDWVYALATRLYSESGRQEMASRLISQLEGEGFDKDIVRLMKQKLSQKASASDSR